MYCPVVLARGLFHWRRTQSCGNGWWTSSRMRHIWTLPMAITWWYQYWTNWIIMDKTTMLTLPTIYGINHSWSDRTPWYRLDTKLWIIMGNTHHRIYSPSMALSTTIRRIITKQPLRCGTICLFRTKATTTATTMTQSFPRNESTECKCYDIYNMMMDITLVSVTRCN